MGMIVGLSTDTASAEHTSQLLLPILRWLLPWATPGQVDTIHGLVRKGAHLTEYAILAALWYRAFRRGRTLGPRAAGLGALVVSVDRKSTRLNSSHSQISYARFCLKTKK